MRRHISVSLAAVAVIAVFVGALVSRNPLRRSEAHIRERLLHDNPLGSHFADVRSWLESRGWRDPGHHEQVGLYWQDPGRASEVVGVMSIGSHLGHYRGVPWRVDVEAFWAFDDQGRLIEVKVRKNADSL